MVKSMKLLKFLVLVIAIDPMLYITACCDNVWVEILREVNN